MTVAVDFEIEGTHMQIGGDLAKKYRENNNVINAIMDPEERADKPSSKSWLRKVLEFCGGGAILDIIDAIMAMAWLGLAVGIIYLVRMLAEHLEFIGKLKIPKNITGKVDEKTALKLGLI